MDWLKKLFGIDLRSLALFRIFLALLMLCELFMHAFDIHTLHGNRVVLPRELWLDFSSNWFVFIDAFGTNVFWQALLFILAAIGSLGLLVGYRTKLMALLVLFFFVLRANDKLALLHTADLFLIVMCFWALFLPIGARYSIDASLEPHYRETPNDHLYSPNLSQQHFSVASAGTIIQALVFGTMILLSLPLASSFWPHIAVPVLVTVLLLTSAIPSIVWVWLAARRKSVPMDSIIIFYDEDCGFCLKMVLVLRELLLSRYVMIHPAQKYPAIYSIMQRENSWVVQDATGQQHVHWHAMQQLFAQRWPFKPIAWLMLFPPFMAMGNWIYRWVADNRGTMSYITARVLPWRAVNIKTTLIGQLIALIFFMFVTIYSIRILDVPYN